MLLLISIYLRWCHDEMMSHTILIWFPRKNFFSGLNVFLFFFSCNVDGAPMKPYYADDLHFLLNYRHNKRPKFIIMPFFYGFVCKSLFLAHFQNKMFWKIFQSKFLSFGFFFVLSKNSLQNFFYFKNFLSDFFLPKFFLLKNVFPRIFFYWEILTKKSFRQKKFDKAKF